MSKNRIFKCYQENEKFFNSVLVRDLLLIARFDDQQILWRHQDLDGPDALEREEKVGLTFDLTAGLIGEQKFEDNRSESLMLNFTIS